MTQNKFTWLDKNEYPFNSNYFSVNNQQLHYIDEGEGEVLLFVHGTPSWSFDYRKIIKDLKTNYRCMAIDHIGFGLSDKPEAYDYSTINHSRTLEKFILEMGLKNITLVVHDFGGPIALNFAINNPEKVSKIVVLNSWLWSSEKDPDFIKLSKILKNPLLLFLYKYLNFSPRFILPKSFGDNKLSAKIINQYVKPFASSKQRNGALAFAKSLLNDQQWFEELWNKRAIISDKPALFLWGMKDPVIKPKNLEKFETAFKNSATIKFETAGHFPQEEVAAEVIKSMRTFLTEKHHKD